MRFSTHFKQSRSKSSSPRPAEIPSELYPLILQYLSKSDLATCLRVCRGFYVEFLPLLYRDIAIDLGRKDNPGLIRLKKKPPPLSFRQRIKKLSDGYKEEDPQAWYWDMSGPEYERFIWGEGVMDTELGTGFLQGKKSEWLARITGRSFLEGEKTGWVSRIMRRPVKYIPPFTIYRLHLTPPTFDYTTHLTLSPQCKFRCRHYKPLIMRNLHTLRLISRKGLYHTRPWTCHCKYNHGGICTSDLECFCPLMSELRPRRIILGGYSDVELDDRDGLTSTWPPLSSDNIPWLEEVIIYANGYGMIESGRVEDSGIKTWGRFKPPEVRLNKLTFILQTENRWRHIHETNYIDPDPSIDRWLPGMVWTRLGMALEGDVGILEVVGIEGLDSNWSGRDMEVVKEEMKKHLMNKGRSQRDAKERVGNVKFTKKMDYVEG